METVILTIEMNGISAGYDLEIPIHIPVRELINTSAGLFDLDIETQEDMDAWRMGMRSPRAPDQIRMLALDQALAESGVRDGYWLTLIKRTSIEEEVSPEQSLVDLPADAGPIAGWRPFGAEDLVSDDEPNELSDEEQKFEWRRLD